ncbi:GNAT family N-acetyltransferase [uncultured Brevundimonas sp.]|uniref:GNAT family N-acetyltransferase n=1 Tax=uncultured Brevundimonas sp. TaxID=213418 RepID=UPI0030EC5C81|tara:strand:- start:3071 stop:4213 length:1143 start_codon:yes stop_codon:yes gene_type:complete
MPGLKLEIVKADSLSMGDVDLWRAMIAANPELASPYFDPDFTRIAAAVCPGAAVAVLHRRGEIVGFFPHQRRGRAIQPLAAPMNDYHGVIARPEAMPELETIAGLLGRSRLSVNAWVGPATTGLARDTMMTVLPAEGYDAWYTERRSAFGKYFKDKERARRSMETELGPIRVERGLRDPALLDHLIALKRDQYRRTVRHDIFACGWTADLLHALMRLGSDSFGGNMAALWAGDRLCAIEYSLTGGDQCHFWFPAYEPGLARCSPGILLTLDTMKQGAAVGLRTFDFGFGGEGYKKYFCNARRTVREAVVLKPGFGASLSQAAVTVINAGGGDRGERLRTSVRRRWNAIEACETRPVDRLLGAVSAARAAAGKAGRALGET